MSKHNGNGNSHTSKLLTCSTGCERKMREEMACAPILECIDSALGRPVRVEELPEHAICLGCAQIAREAGTPTDRYTYVLEDAQRRERQAAHQPKAAKFFQKYRVPEGGVFRGPA